MPSLPLVFNVFAEKWENHITISIKAYKIYNQVFFIIQKCLVLKQFENWHNIYHKNTMFLHPKKENTMTPYDSKTMKLVEILNDLAWIHSDRVNEYQQALIQLKNIDTDVRDEFGKIILNGQYFKQQLLQKVNELIGGDTGMYSALPIFGKIYKVWMDLRTTFSGNTQKTIISSCKYNEEIAINVYKAALNTNIEMSKETRELIEQQEVELRKAHERIRKYHVAPHTIDYRTLYYS